MNPVNHNYHKNLRSRICVSRTRIVKMIMIIYDKNYFKNESCKS
jgi:hypothetical protein